MQEIPKRYMFRDSKCLQPRFDKRIPNAERGKRKHDLETESHGQLSTPDADSEPSARNQQDDSTHWCGRAAQGNPRDQATALARARRLFDPGSKSKANAMQGHMYQNQRIFHRSFSMDKSCRGGKLSAYRTQFQITSTNHPQIADILARLRSPAPLPKLPRLVVHKQKG